jgi:hypothetical protein
VDPGAWNDTDCHHPAEIPGDPKSGNCNPCIWGTETGDRNGTDTKVREKRSRACSRQSRIAGGY